MCFFCSCPRHHFNNLIGGDFNLIQNPDLDRSSCKQTTLSNSASALKAFTNELGLIDPWRAIKPTIIAFFYFSRAHRTFEN